VLVCSRAKFELAATYGLGVKGRQIFSTWESHWWSKYLL